MKKSKNHPNKKAQGVLEYIILVATVIAFLLIFFKPGGTFSRSFDNVIQMQGKGMLNMSRTIF